MNAVRRLLCCGFPHCACLSSALQVAACGLQLYRFWQTVSLFFFTATWKPDSFYERVAANRRDGLHSLVLLDIRVKEPTEASLARGARFLLSSVNVS